MRTILSILFGLALVACRPAPSIASYDQLDYGMPVETADVDGTALAYVDVGQGPQTLVLIHGLGSYMPAWKHNLGPLSERYRVIALDLPGYGRSEKPRAPYSMRYFVAKVRGLLQQLDVHDPVLVGHSMGGQIAITYALMHPEEVHGLVLASPAGLETFADGEAKWLASAVTPEFTCLASDEAIYSRHVGNFHKMPEDAEFMVRDRIAMKGAAEFPAYCEAVSASVTGMLDGPVHDRLPSLKAPTLVTFGKNDTLIPNPFLHGGSTVRLAKREVARIPGATLTVLPKAGHMAQFEQAQPWNQAVIAFVDALPVPVRDGGTSDAEPPAAEPPSAPQPAPEPVESVEDSVPEPVPSQDVDAAPDSSPDASSSEAVGEVQTQESPAVLPADTPSEEG